MSQTTYQIGGLSPFKPILDFRTAPRIAWAPKPAVVKKDAA